MNKEEQLLEQGKIALDIFQFLKYVKIQEPGNLALDYVLWPHLRDFYNQLNTWKLIDMIKAKQIGISWALAVYALWKIYTKPGWNVLELSKGEKEAQELLAKSKIVYNNLPDWMQIYTLEPDSTERFGFKERRSKITAFSTTETAGIGETAGTVIHDESDFHEYYKTNLSHTRATVADGSDRQLISVSTVDKSKPDNYFKEHWKDARDEKNGFHALFYGYDVRPDRDEGFYNQMVKENEDTPWVVEANYPRSAEEALSPQSATSCFKKEVLDKLWENTIKPEVKQGFIYILCPPKIGVQYVAGGDVGEGVGLDYSCLTIVGKQGLKSEVVAVIYTNTLATDLYAYEINELCKVYRNPLLAIENNSLGVAVTNKVVELGYTNLFSTEADRKRKLGKDVTGQEKVGWITGESNKYTATVELVNSINDGSLITRFKPQVKELMEYQWVNKKPVPTGKTHGDTVISLMLANEMLKLVGGEVEASMYVGGKRVW